MANATANATAYTESDDAGFTDAEAAAAWQRALAGSMLAEVTLPHDACKGYSYGYDSDNSEASPPLNRRSHPRSSHFLLSPPPLLSYDVDVMPVFAEEFSVRTPSAASSGGASRALGASGGRRRAATMVPVTSSSSEEPCSCMCSTSCVMPELMELQAARAALGYASVGSTAGADSDDAPVSVG